MVSVKYQRKWEELNRTLERLKKFYNNFIQDGLDSSQGPKDFTNNFFRISYELKEAIKKSNVSPNLANDVEQFASTNHWIALSLDITNQEKHLELNRSRTGKQIGHISSQIHIFDPHRKDRTELKIEIDGQKEDCLELAKKIADAWKNFLIDKNLIS